MSHSRITAATGALLVVSIAGCVSSGPAPWTTSPTPTSAGSTSPDPTATPQTAPPLPPEPRILFEWYGTNAQGKSILVTNADATASTVSSTGKELTQITRVKPGGQRPGEASWTPDGKQIIASLGIVDATQVVDVKIGWVDPGHAGAAE